MALRNAHSRAIGQAAAAVSRGTLEGLVGGPAGLARDGVGAVGGGGGGVGGSQGDDTPPTRDVGGPAFHARSEAEAAGPAGGVGASASSAFAAADPAAPGTTKAAGGAAAGGGDGGASDGAAAAARSAALLRHYEHEAVFRARTGDTGRVLAMLAGGLSPDAADPVGRTVVMASCVAGDLPLLRTLVEAGADVHRVSANGDTALSLANAYKHDAVVEYLESLGCGEEPPAVSSSAPQQGAPPVKPSAPAV